MKQHFLLRIGIAICIASFVQMASTEALASVGGNGPNEPMNARSNILLEEYFTAGTGSIPPQGWSNVTLVGGVQDLWRFDNPRVRTAAIPLREPAAIADFTSGTMRACALESPAFNTSTSGEVMLSFDHHFVSSDSTVAGKVEVFDGFSWIEAMSVRTAFATPQRELLNITNITACARLVRIRFQWIGQGTGYWMVDNVMVIRRPTTELPSPVAQVVPANGSTNVSPRLALGWSPNTPCPTGYKLFLGTDNPPSNVLNGADLGNNPNFPCPSRYEFNTRYYWKVVPYNANGDATNCPVNSFTTGNDPTIASLPYSQNFDGTVYGWESENTNGDQSTWEMTTTLARSAPYAVAAYANPNGTTPGNDWLFTPPLSVTAGHQYKVEFWTRAGNPAQPEALEVRWGRDQLSQLMNEVPAYREVSIANPDYVRASALITAPDSVGSSNINIGWHFFSQAATSFILLDDITISDNGEMPVRFAELSATRVNGNSVRVSWRVLSQANNQQFEVQRALAPALDFQTLASSIVAGHGTTTTAHNYSWIDNAAASGATYYRLKQTSIGGAVYYSNAIRVDGLTSVRSDERAPVVFNLQQNYPNPFNPATKIQFSVDATTRTRLEVFNTLGQVVATLFDGEPETGKLYTVNFNAASLTTGVYFYRLSNGSSSAVKKLMLVK